MSQFSQDYLHALYGFDAVVLRMSPEDWLRPTPCQRWDVRRLVHHNAMICWMTAEMVRGHPAAVLAIDAEGGMPAPSADGYVFNPALFATFDGASFLNDNPDAALRAWRIRRDDVVRALDQPGALGRGTRSPWGQETIDDWLSFAFYDPVVHTWDLTRAVNQQVVIDPDLAERALDAVRKMGESKDIRIPISLAAPQPVSAEEGVIAQLIGFTGRDPGWRAPEAEAQ